MLLSMADTNDPKKIVKVNGNTETRRHLNDLGFVEGAEVTVVNRLGKNVIVNIKESRIAIDQTAANKIVV